MNSAGSLVDMWTAASKLTQLILVLAASLISLPELWKTSGHHAKSKNKLTCESQLEQKTKKTLNGVQYFTCWRRKKRLS